MPTRLLRDFPMDEENTLYPRFMSVGEYNVAYHGSEEIRSALATTSIEEHQGLEDKICRQSHANSNKSLHRGANDRSPGLG